MKIVLASLNPNKLREMREPLLELGIDLIPQTDLSVFGSAEENGDTFEANAELKARYVMEATGRKRRSCLLSSLTPLRGR